MEKTKFNNGIEFPLIVNGVDDFTKDQLSLSFTPEQKNLEEIERIVELKENTQRIEILNDNNELLRVFKDYVVCSSISLKKNQLIGYEITPGSEGGEAADATPGVANEVYGDVVTIVLLRTDVRTEIKKIQEGQELQDGAIAELAEVISTIAEGGAV